MSCESSDLPNWWDKIWPAISQFIKALREWRARKTPQAPLPSAEVYVFAGFSRIITALRKQVDSRSNDSVELFKSALTCLQQGYQAHPDSSLIAYGIAVCYMELGEPNAAKRFAERVEAPADYSLCELKDKLVEEIISKMN